MKRRAKSRPDIDQALVAFKRLMAEVQAEHRMVIACRALTLRLTPKCGRIGG